MPPNVSPDVIADSTSTGCDTDLERCVESFVVLKLAKIHVVFFPLLTPDCLDLNVFGSGSVASTAHEVPANGDIPRNAHTRI